MPDAHRKVSCSSVWNIAFAGWTLNTQFRRTSLVGAGTGAVPISIVGIKAQKKKAAR